MELLEILSLVFTTTPKLNSSSHLYISSSSLKLLTQQYLRNNTFFLAGPHSYCIFSISSRQTYFQGQKQRVSVTGDTATLKFPFTSRPGRQFVYYNVGNKVDEFLVIFCEYSIAQPTFCHCLPIHRLNNQYVYFL